MVIHAVKVAVLCSLIEEYARIRILAELDEYATTCPILFGTPPITPMITFCTSDRRQGWTFPPAKAFHQLAHRLICAHSEGTFSRMQTNNQENLCRLLFHYAQEISSKPHGADLEREFFILFQQLQDLEEFENIPLDCYLMLLLLVAEHLADPFNDYQKYLHAFRCAFWPARLDRGISLMHILQDYCGWFFSPSSDDSGKLLNCLTGAFFRFEIGIGSAVPDSLATLFRHFDADRFRHVRGKAQVLARSYPLMHK